MNNKYTILVSFIVWGLAIIAVFISQGSETANVVVLLISLWLMYLGWRWNMQRGRL